MTRQTTIRVQFDYNMNRFHSLRCAHAAALKSAAYSGFYMFVMLTVCIFQHAITNDDLIFSLHLFCSLQLPAVDEVPFAPVLDNEDIDNAPVAAVNSAKPSVTVLEGHSADILCQRSEPLDYCR